MKGNGKIISFGDFQKRRAEIESARKEQTPKKEPETLTRPQNKIQKLSQEIDSKAALHKTTRYLRSSNNSERPSLENFEKLQTVIEHLNSNDVPAEIIYPPVTSSEASLEKYFNSQSKANAYLVVDEHNNLKVVEDNGLTLGCLSQGLNIEAILQEYFKETKETSTANAQSAVDFCKAILRETGSAIPVIPADLPSRDMLTLVVKQLKTQAQLKISEELHDTESYRQLQQKSDHLQKAFLERMKTGGELDYKKVELYEEFLQCLTGREWFKEHFKLEEGFIRVKDREADISLITCTSNYDNLISDCFPRLTELEQYATLDLRNRGIAKSFKGDNAMAIGLNHIHFKAKNGLDYSLVKDLERQGYSVHVIKMSDINNPQNSIESNLKKHFESPQNKNFSKTEIEAPVTKETIILKGEIPDPETAQAMAAYSKLGIERPGTMWA